MIIILILCIIAVLFSINMAYSLSWKSLVIDQYSSCSSLRQCFVLACDHNDLCTIITLISFGFLPSNHLLIYACQHSKLPVVSFLLRNGISDVNYIQFGGITPLISCLHVNNNNNIKCILLLLRYGANPYLRVYKNMTLFDRYFCSVTRNVTFGLAIHNILLLFMALLYDDRSLFHLTSNKQCFVDIFRYHLIPLLSHI